MARLLTAGRTALIALLAGAFVVLALTAVRVRLTTTPPRKPVVRFDMGAMGLEVDDVGLVASDGVRLAGQILGGAPKGPVVVLCHDWGSSKESLLPLAIALNEEGFTVLLFDFRGHGASAGRSSSLGLDEQRDVLGALDHVRRLERVDRARIGLYGVGMGAHAAVLAARERPVVRVLVLDGLYPDPGFEVVRRFYDGWGPILPRPAFLPVGVFTMLTGARPGLVGAEAALSGMTGRDLLFLAPASDAALRGEIERMYRGIPVQADADGNLLVLPSVPTTGLFGEALVTHDRSVREFFTSRLRPVVAVGPASPYN